MLVLGSAAAADGVAAVVEVDARRRHDQHSIQQPNVPSLPETIPIYGIMIKCPSFLLRICISLPINGSESTTISFLLFTLELLLFRLHCQLN